jgi:hypothetical protein
MDFLVDNATVVTVIVIAVIVLIAIALAALAGLRLWRVVRAAEKRVSVVGAELAAETDRLSAALDAMPERQAELQTAVVSLQARVAALGVLAHTAATASAVLRWPLRYLSGR